MISLIEAKGKKFDIQYLGKGINRSLSFCLKIIDSGIPQLSANFAFMGLSNMYLLLTIGRALLRYEEINSTYLNLHLYYPFQSKRSPNALSIALKHQIHSVTEDSPTSLIFTTKNKIVSSIPVSSYDIYKIVDMIESVLLYNKCEDELYLLYNVFNRTIFEGDIIVTSTSGINYDLANIMYTVEEEYGLWYNIMETR